MVRVFDGVSGADVDCALHADGNWAVCHMYRQVGWAAVSHADCKESEWCVTCIGK